MMMDVFCFFGWVVVVVIAMLVVIAVGIAVNVVISSCVLLRAVALFSSVVLFSMAFLDVGESVVDLYLHSPSKLVVVAFSRYKYCRRFARIVPILKPL